MKILLCLFLSFTAVADAEYWLRLGGGKGFSDFKEEKHEDSEMMYGGLKGAYVNDKWEYSVGFDILKYEIYNRINDNDFRKAKHTNENGLIYISPKYRFEKFKLGPYVGRYLDKNILTRSHKSQDVLGVEANYMLHDKWSVDLGTEMNIDHSEKHKIAKLGLSYKFDEIKKPVKIAKKCEYKSLMILFDFDKAEVKDVSRLWHFAKGLDDIRIVGHTDTIGSEKYNEKLSRKRAEAVRDSLLEGGYSYSHIEYFGELFPLESKKKSRRVIVSGCK